MSSLDFINQEQILELLIKINLERKITILLSTHAPEIANIAKQQIHLSGGRISFVSEK